MRRGDLLLTWRGAPLRPGSVVLCDLPPDGHGNARPRAVKRLAGTDPADPTRWMVDSDDPVHGVSSHDPTVGSLPASAVVARVLLRIRCSRAEKGVRRVR